MATRVGPSPGLGPDSGSQARIGGASGTCKQGDVAQRRGSGARVSPGDAGLPHGLARNFATETHTHARNVFGTLPPPPPPHLHLHLLPRSLRPMHAFKSAVNPPIAICVAASQLGASAQLLQAPGAAGGCSSAFLLVLTARTPTPLHAGLQLRRLLRDACMFAAAARRRKVTGCV